MRQPLDDAEMNKIIRDNGYSCAKEISENRIAALAPFLYTVAIITMTKDDSALAGYDDRWCYHTWGDALIALAEWDGTDEPKGWHRHPASGRRRKGEDEWVNP